MSMVIHMSGTLDGRKVSGAVVKLRAKPEKIAKMNSEKRFDWLSDIACEVADELGGGMMALSISATTEASHEVEVSLGIYRGKLAEEHGELLVWISEHDR